MKTAEEWVDELPCNDGEFVATDAIKQIQLDAMKEGMRLAKEEIIPDGNPICAIERIEQKIKELK